MKLHHYTCWHAVQAIQQDGIIRAGGVPMTTGFRPLVWLTDLDWPPAEQLFGGVRLMADCDRTAYRFTIDIASARPWRQYARDNQLGEVARVLAAAPGAQHDRWWVTPLDLKAPEPEVRP